MQDNNYCMQKWSHKCGLMMFHYFSDYVKKNSLNETLYTNSFRFLCFPNDVYSKFTQLQVKAENKYFDQQYSDTILQTFLTKIHNYNALFIWNLELTFKKTFNELDKEVVFFDYVLKKYSPKKVRSSCSKQELAKFYFVSSCAIFLMFFNLCIVFFDMKKCQNKRKKLHLYLAFSVWETIFMKRIVDASFFNNFKADYERFVYEVVRFYDTDCTLNWMSNTRFCEYFVNNQSFILNKNNE